MSAVRYQLVILGPSNATHRGQLEAAVSELFTGIGLDFATVGELLLGQTPEWNGFPVAVWFGGKDAAEANDLALMKEFLTRGFSLFPVVADLKNYSAQVPEELHSINGQAWDLSRVSADVMKGFRLARKLRQAFISYRRSESSGVAQQLFHELTDRTFRVFLDTASVEGGVDFQTALWSRMADVDIVVLLDSPTALDSDWVHKELNRAHDLGLGVVQLIWPGHAQSKGTELSFPLPLQAADYVNNQTNGSGTLTATKMTEVLSAIETQRIRSLSARRTRLVEGLLAHATGKGCAIYVHPVQNVDVLKGSAKIAEIVPFVGVPDALAIYQHETDKKHEPTIVVYNGLGVDDEWAKHLRWLNGKAGVPVHPIDEIADCIGSII
jgi:hypothetical protein